MKETPLISIIVPIYKVEKYLNRCVESIVNQTYKNLEIILVDDGSPDKCPQMCDAWAKKDGRIKVVHKENGGLSDARNAGMAIAAGKHVSFIDSDDYVAVDFIKSMYDVMLKENSDIVECSVVKCFEDGKVDDYTDDLAEKSYNTVEALSGLISESSFHQHVWNKLYKADIALSVPFEKGKYNEDEFWTYQVFGQASKVTKYNKTIYFYFQRSGSIMGEGYSLRRLDALEAKTERQKYIEKRFPQLSSISKLDLFGTCMYALQMSLRYLTGTDKTQAVNRINVYKKQITLTKEELNTVTGKQKLWCSFANTSLVLCCRVRNILNIGF